MFVIKWLQIFFPDKATHVYINIMIISLGPVDQVKMVSM